MFVKEYSEKSCSHLKASGDFRFGMHSSLLNAVLEVESIVQWDGLLTSTLYILFLFPRLAHEVHMFIFTQFGDG